MTTAEKIIQDVESNMEQGQTDVNFDSIRYIIEHHCGELESTAPQQPVPQGTEVGQHWLVEFLPLLDKFKSGAINEKGLVSWLNSQVLQPLYNAIKDDTEVGNVWQWVKASEVMPTDEDEIYVIRRLNKKGKYNMDVAVVWEGCFILGEDSVPPIIQKDLLQHIEWLSQAPLPLQQVQEDKPVQDELKTGIMSQMSMYNMGYKDGVKYVLSAE